MCSEEMQMIMGVVISVLDIVKFLVPVVLIVFCTIDIFKIIVSKKEDVMISEKIIQAGIRFDKDDCLMYTCIPQYYQTGMKKYIDKYLEKEIFRESCVYQKK